tara:strand:+ start:4031 stop:5164 length:1134 start_codon:yes stop_codon:yes gene_type:complete
MAYNVLKGNVEGSVDQHGDQEIDGVKVFKNTISASVFWDTDAQSPCATMKDVAIQSIKGNVNDGLIIADKEHGARTHHNLTYNSDTETLAVNTLSAKTFVGSGVYLQDIPTDAFTGQINANFLNHGAGLQNVRGTLQLSAHNGLILSEGGVGLNLALNSGLSVANNKISIDPSKLEPVNADGQNLSDNDLLVVSDVSRGNSRCSSLNNLYESYIKSKIPHPVGTAGTLQIKGKKGFASSDNLNFNSANNTLNIDGTLNSKNITSKGKMVCEGAVFFNIVTVDDDSYEVSTTDYTIVCDAKNNIVNVKLPPAQNNKGRVIIVKKSNSDTFKINSNKVKVTCEESNIDLNNVTEIKMNYSSRTFQSDGKNWYIIGTKGT